MAWFLADDNLSEHPKVLKLLSGPVGFAALGFWTVCGTWARRHRTGGDVPRTVADASARKCGRYADASELASALVDAELWVGTADGYRFHDWEDVYKEEAKQAERKEKDAARKRAERARKKSGRDMDASADSPRTKPRTPGSSPSPSPSPIPLTTFEGESARLRAAPPSDSEPPLPASTKPPTACVTAAHLDTLRSTIAAEAERMKIHRTPRATDKQYREAAEDCIKLASKLALTYPEACTELAQAALKAHRDEGKSFGFALLEVDPRAPPKALRGAKPFETVEELRKQHLIACGNNDFATATKLAERIKELQETEDRKTRYARA